MKTNEKDKILETHKQLQKLYDVIYLIKDKEEISRRRDFLFLFFFEQGGKKKIHSRQESFHLLQKRARALKEHRHTRAHTKPERERERKRRRFFLLL